MSDLIIKVENLSKQYQLGQVGTGTLAHDINRWFSRIRGKEDPSLKIGQENILSSHRSPLTAHHSPDFVWALHDINFEIRKGEVLGIIGKNGAGKSTLLKILSQVTSPTQGSVKVKGRIASLLEVGTGFHPDLTGRENIFLNGAILGMNTNEIKSKLDEIVDFSGIEKYIDTPVKRYSSGMYVRLAFAVAAHLEPEILIVDEVLAVGDAEFQKKCLGKMQDVSTEDGRTVLFVSHNLASVKSLCSSGIVLEKGNIICNSSAYDAVGIYLNQSNNYSRIDLSERKDRSGSHKLKFVKIIFFDKENKEIAEIISGDFLKIRLYYNIKEKIDFDKFFLSLNIFNELEQLISYLPSDELGYKFSNLNNNSYIDFIIPKIILRQGVYYLSIYSSILVSAASQHEEVDVIEKATKIEILKGDFWQSGNFNRPNGIIIDFKIEN